MLAIASGGQASSSRPGDFDVPAWFAWAVAGGFGAFWVGALAAGELRVGWITALAWVVAVLLVAGIRRLSRRLTSA